MQSIELNSPQISSPISLNISIAKPTSVPQNNNQHANEKTKPSSVIIFSIVNSTIGSNIILLPLSIASSGVLTSLIVATIIGFISYRTCQLTHLHSKPEEIEYITTIHRIVGKGWMYVYSFNSIIILLFACIVYFLSLSDVTYSCLKLITNSTDWPSKDTIHFSSFSFQYTGIIIMALVCWVFFISKLDLIVEIAGKGVYSAIVEAIFALYIGFKAILSNKVHAAFYTDTPVEEIGMFTSNSYRKTIGVFAMAFLVHNSVVEILKKSNNPSKNTRNVGVAYLITFIIYMMTGVIGATGVYSHMDMSPNTILSNELYQDESTFTTIFLIITQIMTAFQLTTVLAINNNILRIQFFILFLGENKTPSRLATAIFNVFFIGTLLIVQILNIKPGVVMSYGGAIFGFVIIYLLPIMIHLKEIRARQVHDHHKYAVLHGEPEGQDFHEVEITKFIKEKKTVHFMAEYIGHGAIMAVGVYILISQIISFFE